MLLDFQEHSLPTGKPFLHYHIICKSLMKIQMSSSSRTIKEKLFKRAKLANSQNQASFFKKKIYVILAIQNCLTCYYLSNMYKNVYFPEYSCWLLKTTFKHLFFDTLFVNAELLVLLILTIKRKRFEGVPNLMPTTNS